MCVYSRISDWGQEITFPKFPSSPKWDQWPWITEPAQPTFPWNVDSWAEYKELLKRAVAVDEILDQPDCEDPEKVAWMADVEATLAQQADDITEDTVDDGTRFSPSGTTEANNYDDDDGNPAGGWVEGTGIVIDWQNGPLGRGENRKQPNGAFVEEVLWAVIQRIEYYQSSKFNCKENEQALNHCLEALWGLNSRTANREARQVEGTHAK